MRIEIVGIDLPLARISDVVRAVAKELNAEARWDGKTFHIITKPEAISVPAQAKISTLQGLHPVRTSPSLSKNEDKR
ncbi:hypothetical protein A4U49_13140 [Acidithiobacillus ferrivorans]|uniref:hypothetical protein n=1 Tax=Acidithiobacillus ferrivorans TaxID=160808 RepID=UPI0008940C57|nr:hypothetical protein [Acidithiobacillus ferrivorans]OFA15393.1 hypothetical protein A4U49_13140 [Acidithiobacillus ferrivorans]